MITPILSLGKYNNLFAQKVDIEKYRQEMNRMRNAVSVDEERKADDDSSTPWSDYVNLRQQLGKTDPFSTKYLILCMYTLIPPVRDNYGRVYIVYDAENIPECEYNLYYPETGRLILREYKTDKFCGIIDESLPGKLREIINKSLEMFHRKYLVTRDCSPEQLYDENKGGKPSSIITSRFFDFSINDLRHSFETYVYQFHNKFLFAELKLI